jgi:hypothetical protein
MNSHCLRGKLDACHDGQHAVAPERIVAALMGPGLAGNGGRAPKHDAIEEHHLAGLWDESSDVIPT